MNDYQAQARYRAKGRQVSMRIWGSTFDLMVSLEARLGLKRADMINAALERLQAVGNRRFGVPDVMDFISGRPRDTQLSVVFSEATFILFEQLKEKLSCDGTEVLLSALRVLDEKPTFSELDILKILEREATR